MIKKTLHDFFGCNQCNQHQHGIVIAQNGTILRNVCCQEVTIMGSTEGNINNSGLLVLESQSSVLGKITSLAMEMHAGAKIESVVWPENSL